MNQVGAYGCGYGCGLPIVLTILASIFFPEKEDNGLAAGGVALIVIMILTGLFWIFFFIMLKAPMGSWAGKINKREINEKLDGLQDFSIAKKIVEPWGSIAIDEEKQKILLQEGTKKMKIYPFSALVSYKIIEDKRIHGEIFGTTGSLVEDFVSGVIVLDEMSQTEKEDIAVNKISLEIIFKDRVRRRHIISFFDATKEIDERSWDREKENIKLSDKKFIPSLKDAIFDINEWALIFGAIIERNAITKKKGDGMFHKKIVFNEFIKDLTNLNKMREQGIITEKEFQQQKKNLLG